MNKENEKNLRQMKIWDKLEEQEKKLQDSWNATVIDVVECSNSDFFGTTAKYDKRNGIKITVEIDENGETFEQWFSIPSIRGAEKSNLMAFKTLYGSYPKPDLKIKAIINDNGFFAIKLD